MNARILVAQYFVGTRKILNTLHPIMNQVVRDQRPEQKPQWELVVGLCNGVPDTATSYTTKRAAIEALQAVSKSAIPVSLNFPIYGQQKRCGKCATVGTNTAGPPAHSPSCANQ